MQTSETKENSWHDHEMENEGMKNYCQSPDDAHFNASIPWWAVWGNHESGRGRGGVGTVGMVLGIIAIVLVTLIILGWLGFGDRHHDRYGYGGNQYNGVAHNVGNHNQMPTNYYQDRCYALGDQLAQTNAERYSDVVGMRVLDKSSEYTNRELSQYATYSDKLNQKDQIISKMYADGLFNKAECGISHCVKETPNMVLTKQIVAPANIDPCPPRPCPVWDRGNNGNNGGNGNGGENIIPASMWF